MNKTVVKVIIETDGKYCNESCPYLIKSDAVVTNIYKCYLFDTSLHSDDKPIRSDVCVKAESEPRKSYITMWSEDD